MAQLYYIYKNDRYSSRKKIQYKNLTLAAAETVLPANTKYYVYSIVPMLIKKDTMQQKVIEYGTTHKVTVIRAERLVITVVDENKEGYILIGHGLDPLPKKDDKGTIVFEKNDGVAKGHWQYYTT